MQNEKLAITVFSGGTKIKTWLENFNHTSAVILVVNSVAFRKNSIESDTIEYLKESTTIFNGTANSRFFERVPIFLVFSMMDVFEESTNHIQFENFFDCSNSDLSSIEILRNEYFEEKIF